MVCPTIWGKITLARLQVRKTFFSPFWFIASTLFKSLGSIKGPFFNDLDISDLYLLAALLTATANNILIRLFIAAGFVSQSGFTPWAFRTSQADRLAPFTTTMRMVTWGHCRSTNCWANTFVAFAPCFTKFDIAMVQVADLTNRRIASLIDQADFT